MTDRDDPSPDRADGTDADPAATADDRRWFRSTVGPVVDADPVSDDWEALRARVTGEGPTPVALGAAADRPRRTGRLVFAAAAAVILLAGVVGVLALTGDPAGDPVATDAPPSGDPSGDPVEGTGPAGEATGWYVPTDLPDGWSLHAAALDLVTLDCPCRTVVWLSPDRFESLAFFSGPAEEAGQGPSGAEAFDGGRLDGDRRRVDLGGVDGTLVSWTAPPDAHGDVELGHDLEGLPRNGAPDARSRAGEEVRGFDLSWTADGVTATVTTAGWDEEEVVRAGRSFVAADGTVSDISGLLQVVDVDFDAGSYSVPQVTVVLEGPAGQRLAYGISTAGGGLPFGPRDRPMDVGLQGQPLPLYDLGGPGAPRYVGLWPGADVVAPGPIHPATAPGEDAAPDPDDLNEVMASLRPATTEEWRAFLADARTTDERLLEAERLADLGTLPERPTTPGPQPTPEPDPSDPTDPAPGLEGDRPGG